MTIPFPPTDITLNGNSESGHSNKVRLALVFGQVEHHYVHVNILLPQEQRPEPFRSLARFNEVPLLVWGTESFVQSDAILCLLAERLQRMGARARNAWHACVNGCSGKLRAWLRRMEQLPGWLPPRELPTATP